MENTVQALTDSLRELATFIDEHPQFARALDGHRILLAARNAEEFEQFARDLGGKRAKEFSDNYMAVVRSFGAINLDVFIARDEVCEARVVGTEKVVETAVRCVHCQQPIAQNSVQGWLHVTVDGSYRMCGTSIDDDGNEAGGQPATPPSFTAQVVERPVVEWECKPVLTAAERQRAADHYGAMAEEAGVESAVTA